MPEHDEAPIIITINGQAVEARKGAMLVDAAKAVGVEIPIFCYEPRLGKPIGACRMCLVEVEGMRGLQTACSTPVAPDMVVNTTSDQVKGAQDGVLELHVSVMVNAKQEYRARGLTLAPTTVRRFLERVDLRYDPKRPAPLETELSSGDRILCGPPDNPSVLEFLMLPKEER